MSSSEVCTKEEMIETFKRQMAIPDWNQEVVGKQTALLLGVGGLGGNVAIGLLRLGVKKIIIVDMDVVDQHNLNRQFIYQKSDVGKLKVERAAENLKFHNICSEIVPVQCNAVTNWGKIVELAKESDVIFNMIDVGNYFDVAVQSLALATNITLVVGGTFAETLTVDFFPKNSPNAPCMMCIDDVDKKDILSKLNPNLILDYKDINWIPADDNPPGQTNFFVCSMASNMMLTLYFQFLFKKVVPTRTIYWASTFEIVKWEMQREEKCPFGCKKFKNEEE